MHSEEGADGVCLSQGFLFGASDDHPVGSTVGDVGDLHGVLCRAVRFQWFCLVAEGRAHGFTDVYVDGDPIGWILRNNPCFISVLYCFLFCCPYCESEGCQM